MWHGSCQDNRSQSRGWYWLVLNFGGTLALQAQPSYWCKAFGSGKSQIIIVPLPSSRLIKLLFVLQNRPEFLVCLLAGMSLALWYSGPWCGWTVSVSIDPGESRLWSGKSFEFFGSAREFVLFFGVGFQQDRVQGWPLHSASRLISLGMFVRVVILELLLCCSGLFRTIPL